MNIIKKVVFATLMALSALSLTASLPAFADGASDVQTYCSNCHGLRVNGVIVAGDGGRNGPQRPANEWVASIGRMYSVGLPVLPTDTVVGMANYLASIPPLITTTSSTTLSSTSTTSTTITTVTTTTTTTIMPPFCNNGPAKLIDGSWVCPYPPQLCYDSSGVGQYISGMYPPYPCPTGMSTTPPPTCSGGLPTFDGTAWTCPTTTTSSTTTSTTTSTTLGGTTLTCYSLFPGTVFTTTASSCPSGYSSTLPNCQPLNLVISGSYWYCDRGTTTTSNTSTTTTSSTTTTTLCNTYVNGTTQHPYSGSGSGSCHSFANDDVTGVHIVRDQSYCKKHMSHFNSKGNHVHAYPHPMCM